MYHNQTFKNNDFTLLLTTSVIKARVYVAYIPHCTQSMFLYQNIILIVLNKEMRSSY